VATGEIGVFSANLLVRPRVGFEIRKPSSVKVSVLLLPDLGQADWKIAANLCTEEEPRHGAVRKKLRPVFVYLSTSWHQGLKETGHQATSQAPLLFGFLTLNGLLRNCLWKAGSPSSQMTLTPVRSERMNAWDALLLPSPTRTCSCVDCQLAVLVSYKDH
jgi:hypothetical protein